MNQINQPAAAQNLPDNLMADQTPAVSAASLPAWIALSRCDGIGPILARRLVETLGGAEKVLRATSAELATVDGIGPGRAASLPGKMQAVDSHAVLEEARQRSIRIICPDDPEWPPGLTKIPDPPVVLYLRGRLLRQDALAVGIVGARRCTLYGREQSDKFAAALAELGVTIISGGARGIDTAGHSGALRAGGRTIVVQGCGLEHCYPPENLDLYDRIVREDRGCIISELAPGQPPLPENFPPRNRIITGMSLGILVVEANLRSGSLITARLAADDYGREVFALPGRVDSAASSGTHYLIKTGSARLVENVQDILEALGQLELLGDGHTAPESANAPQRPPAASMFADSPPPAAGRSAKRDRAAALVPAPHTAAAEIELSPPQRTIMGLLVEQPMATDELCERSLLPAGVVMAEMTFLQIRGLVRRNPDGSFELAAPRNA